MDDRRITIEELREQQRQNWPEMYARSHPAMLRLIRLSDQLLRATGEALQTAALLPAEFDVLAALRRQPPPHVVSPTELCRALLISSGGLTKLLYRLHERQLIHRPPNPQDGRSLLVELSNPGKQRLEAAMTALTEVHHRQIAVLGNNEQEQLNQLLEKMLRPAEHSKQPHAGVAQTRGSGAERDR